MREKQDALDSAPPGGHEFSSPFSGRSWLPSPKKRGKALPTSLAIASVLCIASALQIGLNVAFDDAEAALESANSSLSREQAHLTAALSDLAASRLDADGIVATDSGRFLPGDIRQTLEAESATAADAITEIETVLAADIAVVPPKPVLPWELVAITTTLTAEADAARQTAESADTLLVAARTQETALEARIATGLDQAAAAAASFEATHSSARNLDVVALRDAAAELRAEAESPNGEGDTLFAALETAADQVLVSEQAEMAEKAGPLLQNRLEVEAYARSLAPGVLLDFDWGTLVNGIGLNGSMSGQATWWYDSGGYSTIELSNSVAEQWPAERSKALIAHEVGHAISVRCEGMYDTSTADNIEAWATAWAISMGHTDDANGVWAYGYPSDALIAQAAQCR